MKKFFKIFIICTLIIMVLTVGGLGIAYLSITKNATIDNTLLPQSTVNTVFLCDNGNIVEGFSNDFVTYQEIPDNLKNAFIALEDKRFYQHHGVDIIRIFGATINNIKKRNFAEGGSTITQQLIKNTHLSQDKTINRKLNEIKLAKQLEKQYDKNQIITMYMNIVYFGKGIYGVKNASKSFFNKNIKDLSLSECATLSAVLKNPSKYSPLVNIENSTQRRNVVLDLMYEQKYITKKQRDISKCEPTILDTSAIYSNTQSYMLSSAYEASSILNIDIGTLLSNNYTIETYLNSDHQQTLTNVIGNPSYYVLNENGIRGEGLGIIVDNKTCGISGYFCTKKRNIYNFSRPYGSTIKPILVYAPALHHNLITSSTPVLDEKTDFSGYMPSNYKDKYYGWIDIRTAIMQSSNISAVKTYNSLGYDKALNFANNINIDISNDKNNATVALGNLSYGNTMIDILGGYTMLANYGEYKKPTFIKCIKNSQGQIIYQNETSSKGVLSQENAYIMTDILKDTAKYGTAKGLNGLNFDIASKTGTVGNKNSNSDCYNISYTNENTLLVWHGNSTNDIKKDLPLAETGGSYTTRSMRDILKTIYKDKKPNNFYIPQGIVYKNIDNYCIKNQQLLKLATENTPKNFIKQEIFSKDNYPTEYSTCFDNFIVQNVVENQTDGIINIKFDNAPYLYYDIIREIDGKQQLIKRYNPSHQKISFYDISCPYNKMVKYYIKPYFYNQFNKKIDGITYETASFYLKNDIFFDNYDY